MKLVIDIPEDVYTRLFDNGIQDNEIAVDDVCEMARALRLGTPLSPRVRIEIKCKYDSLENCHSTDCLACVLEKMRNEIIELRREQNVGVLECLDIIDRYKKESEEE